jgi:hypothetical protein
MHPRSHAPSSIWNNLGKFYSILIILNFRFLLRFTKKTDNRTAAHRSMVTSSMVLAVISRSQVHPHVVDITTPELLTPSSSDLLVSPERMLTWQVRLPTLLPPPQIQAKIPEPITSRSSLLNRVQLETRSTKPR